MFRPKNIGFLFFLFLSGLFFSFFITNFSDNNDLIGTIEQAQSSSLDRTPVAIIQAPSTYGFSDNLILDGRSSYDPDAPTDYITAFQWDLTEDGNNDYTGDLLNLTPAELSGLGWKLGDKVSVRLTVNDSDSEFGIDEVFIYLRETGPIAKFIPIPDRAYCGENVTLDASDTESSDPTKNITQYEWDLDNDGIYELVKLTPIANFSQAIAGNYTINLRVTDSAGSKMNTSQIVQVDYLNNHPFGMIRVPDTYFIGENLVLNASGSFDPDAKYGDSVIYKWDLDGNNDFNDAEGLITTIPSESMIAFGWTTPGFYKTLILKLIDEKGYNSLAYNHIFVQERKIIASFSINPPTGIPSQLIEFNANISKPTDPSRPITSYAWDLDNDGQFDDGNTNLVSKSWDSVGLYPVSVNVSDNFGLWSIVQKIINITNENRAPVAVIFKPGSNIHTVGNNLLLDAIDSWDPDAGTGDSITAWNWEIYSRISIAYVSVSSADSPNIPWSTLNALGWEDGYNQTIRLIVTDNFGLQSIFVYYELWVYDNTPTAVARVQSKATLGEIIHFHADTSFTERWDRSIVQYRWDFNRDGSWEITTSTPSIASYSWSDFGTKYYRLQVTDNLGYSSTSDGSITIDTIYNNPISRINGSSFLVEGNALILDSAKSFDQDALITTDCITTYRWDINNDFVWDYTSKSINLNWATLTGTYGWITGEKYNVTLQVVDTYSKTGNSTIQIRIIKNELFASFKKGTDFPIQNEKVTFNAHASYSSIPNDPIIRYRWDFQDDGVFEIESSSPIVNWCYSVEGYYNITLEIVTYLGNINTTELKVLIYFFNHAPIPIITSPEILHQGASIWLSANYSYDPDNSSGDFIIIYYWDLNQDGVFDQNSAQFQLTTEMVTNLGWSAGENQILLQIRDTHGLAVEINFTVTYIMNTISTETSTISNTSSGSSTSNSSGSSSSTPTSTSETNNSNSQNDLKIGGFPIGMILITIGISVFIPKINNNRNKRFN